MSRARFFIAGPIALMLSLPIAAETQKAAPNRIFTPEVNQKLKQFEKKFADLKFYKALGAYLNTELEHLKHEIENDDSMSIADPKEKVEEMSALGRKFMLAAMSYHSKTRENLLAPNALSCLKNYSVGSLVNAVTYISAVPENATRASAIEAMIKSRREQTGEDQEDGEDAVCEFATAKCAVYSGAILSECLTILGKRPRQPSKVDAGATNPKVVPSAEDSSSPSASKPYGTTK